MSRKKSSQRKSAAQPRQPQSGAQGSPDARTARSGEPEAQPGAAPSNTAPYNSNASEPWQFRLLRLGVDSLYLSYPGTLSAAAHAALQHLKTLAQSDNPDQIASAQYAVGSHIFEVKDRGAGMFPYVLADNAYRIQLAKTSKKVPMAYVQVSAHYLAHKNPTEIASELRTILSDLGDLDGTESVSRIDLAADFTSSVVMDSWHRSAWVTRATEIHSYAKDQQFTGWTVGMGGVLAMRLYDKIAEIHHSGKAWVFDLWKGNGWKDGDSVWRLEFEFKRDFLKERGLRSLEDVLEHLNGLWSYATTEWLRLTMPSEDDATRSRWPIHPLWLELASVDWESAHNVQLIKYSNARVPADARMLAIMLGVLTSYMAAYNIDDANDALDALALKLGEHYGRLAAHLDMSFEELVAKRVAVRAREFNTAINAPGLTDKLKQHYLDSLSQPYRDASRGH